MVMEYRPEPNMPAQSSPFSRKVLIARVLWGVVYVLLFRPSPRLFHRWRNWLLRLFGAQLHPTARMYPRAKCWGPWNLTMGKHACIAEEADVYCVSPVSIGDYSTVSQYGYVCTATHDFEDVNHPLVTAPIVIGNRVWLAADVFIGPGVTIGDGVVVGARSSVFSDLPAWTVCVGTPAKPLRKRGLGPADFGMGGMEEAGPAIGG